VKLPYREGDWFAVPLPSGGFALGLVARATRRGKILLGYFFGPRSGSIPDPKVIESLKPSAAVLVARFGDLGLIEGEWPILGMQVAWTRAEWPVPSFVNYDSLSGRFWRTEYADDDPNRLVSRTPIAEEEAQEFQRDIVSGYVSVATKLDELLASDSH